MRSLTTVQNAVICSFLLFAAPLSAGEIQRKMRAIVIPKVELTDVPVAEVIKFLRRASKRFDPDRRGINLFVRLNPAHAAAIKQSQVTLSFVNLPLEEVIRYFCMAAGLHYRVEEKAVVIADRSIALDRMQTRFYRLQPGVVDAARTRAHPEPLVPDDEDDD